LANNLVHGVGSIALADKAAARGMASWWVTEVANRVPNRVPD
jgi:hypothetical protein